MSFSLTQLRALSSIDLRKCQGDGAISDRTHPGAKRLHSPGRERVPSTPPANGRLLPIGESSIERASSPKNIRKILA